MKTFYQVLGIQDDANADQIKEAFQKLTAIWHPDKAKIWLSHAAPEELNFCNEIFAAINNAYSTLINRDSRAVYDEQLKFKILIFSNPAERQKQEDFFQKWNNLKSEYAKYLKRQNDPKENIHYLERQVQTLRGINEEQAAKIKQLTASPVENSLRKTLDGYVQAVYKQGHELGQANRALETSEKAREALRQELNASKQQLDELRALLKEANQTIDKVQAEKLVLQSEVQQLKAAESSDESQRKGRRPSPPANVVPSQAPTLLKPSGLRTVFKILDESCYVPGETWTDVYLEFNDNQSASQFLMLFRRQAPSCDVEFRILSFKERPNILCAYAKHKSKLFISVAQAPQNEGQMVLTELMNFVDLTNIPQSITNAHVFAPNSANSAPRPNFFQPEPQANSLLRPIGLEVIYNVMGRTTWSQKENTWCAVHLVFTSRAAAILFATIFQGQRPNAEINLLPYPMKNHILEVDSVMHRALYYTIQKDRARKGELYLAELKKHVDLSGVTVEFKNSTYATQSNPTRMEM